MTGIRHLLEKRKRIMISKNSNGLFTRTNIHFKVLQGEDQCESLFLFSTVINLMFEVLKKDNDSMIKTSTDTSTTGINF